MKSLIALCLLLSSPGWAQSMKVIKVKGSQAIVTVSGGTVDVGQVIKVPAMGGDDDELEMTASSTGPRRHVVGISSAIYRTGKTESGTTSNTVTVLDLNARYGWVSGQMEYGAIGILGMSDSGSGNAMTFGAGGFFDFNLSANKAGNDMIFGGGVEASYKSTAYPNGAGSEPTMDLFPSGFMKWFVLKTPTALRVDLGYDYNEVTRIGGTKDKNSSLIAKAGFAVYF